MRVGYTDPKSKKLKEPHNTDGIDPGGGSSDIWVHDVFISNGDDSVAVKPSTPCTRNILVENSVFQHGHGCSIGSVGHGCVEDVVFRNITMRSQMAGCRIKTYSSTEGSGHVHNISWRRIHMEKTSACITVDANYKPPPPPPVKYFVNVSEILFEDITGTDCGGDAVAEFSCPALMPCSGIRLERVHLDAGSSKPHMRCSHAQGIAKDTVPSSCLEAPHPPAPPTPPTPTCDVDGCFARCVNQFGGTVYTGSYYCAKGCAGMSGQRVADKQKFCRVDPDKRSSACKKECKSSSSNGTRVDECIFGCGWWD